MHDFELRVHDFARGFNNNRLYALHLSLLCSVFVTVTLEHIIVPDFEAQADLFIQALRLHRSHSFLLR